MNYQRLLTAHALLLIIVSVGYGENSRIVCKPGTKIISKKPVKKVITSCTNMGSGVVIRALDTVQSSNLNGVSWGYWPNGRPESKYILKNDDQVDSFFRWDSLGYLVARGFYKDGKPFGKQETWFGADKPKDVRNFISKGIEEGPTFKWWPNGNKRLEGIKKNDDLVSATEFYFDGRPRVKYLTKFEPEVKSVFKTKYINAEAWAPNGNPCGKIQDGNGEWLLFPNGSDSTDQTTFREVYKDSLAIKIEKVDSATVAKWRK